MHPLPDFRQARLRPYQDSMAHPSAEISAKVVSCASAHRSPRLSQLCFVLLKPLVGYEAGTEPERNVIQVRETGSVRQSYRVSCWSASCAHNPPLGPRPGPLLHDNSDLPSCEKP